MPDVLFKVRHSRDVREYRRCGIDIFSACPQEYPILRKVVRCKFSFSIFERAGFCLSLIVVVKSVRHLVAYRTHRVRYPVN